MTQDTETVYESPVKKGVPSCGLGAVTAIRQTRFHRNDSGI